MSNIGFFKNENIEDHLASLRSLYKIFVSMVRDVNLRGENAIHTIFKDEYSSSKVNEISMLDDCSLFATRERAEQIMWKKQGSILEIGVGGGDHGISLISQTKAKSYLGIDIALRQMSASAKKNLNILANSCEIRYWETNSIAALQELVDQNVIFDSIYIDANHLHQFVSKELELCSKLVRRDGRIVLNDYLNWFVGSMEPCGVKRATNEFLEKNPNYKIDYYAINESDISLIKTS